MTPGTLIPGCHRDGDDILLTMRVQPRASRTEWSGSLGDAVKLRLTSSPVDGKANAELTKWLAKEFGVPKSAIVIEFGETGRNKRIRIHNAAKIPALLFTN